MDAAVLHALGRPPRFEEFPEPTPGEGEVLIHVCAAALKPVDKQLAGESTLPASETGIPKVLLHFHYRPFGKQPNGCRAVAPLQPLHQLFHKRARHIRRHSRIAMD